MENIFSNFISLGYNCYPRQIINQITKNNNTEYGETLFFDYIETNFNSLIQILTTIDISSIINLENLSDTRKNTRTYIDIRLKNMWFHSMHDITYDKVDMWINNRNSTLNDYIIDKYRRRHIRLINKIKNNYCIFLCWHINDITQKKILYEALKNYTNNFSIIFLEDNENNELLEIHSEINSYTINLYKITISGHLSRFRILDYKKLEDIFSNIYYKKYY
jgi:hypothetical protein